MFTGLFHGIGDGISTPILVHPSNAPLTEAPFLPLFSNAVKAKEHWEVQSETNVITNFYYS